MDGAKHWDGGIGGFRRTNEMDGAKHWDGIGGFSDVRKK